MNANPWQIAQVEPRPERYIANATAVGAVIGLLLFAAAHAHLFFRSPSGFYVIASLTCAFFALARVSAMVIGWKLTSAEQGLLHLAPRRPSARTLKRVFVIAMVRVQRGPWLCWLAISVVLVGLGWIGPVEFAYSALYVMATSLVACSYLLLTLASREVKEWQLAGIVIALLAVAGVALFQFGAPFNLHLRGIGVAMCLMPPALVCALFYQRPLQFPAIPKSHSVRTGR